MKVKNRGLTAWHEQLSYLFFGILTTVINYAMFWLLNELWQGRHILLANLLTFIAATAFAFVTNKQFVFHSHCWKPRLVLRECLSFTAARLFSFLVEELGLFVSAYVLFLDQYRFGPVDGIMLSKILLSLLAVALNYFFSKFLVFAQKKGGSDS